MDFIFKLALFFIPFDNLKIAPSAGWAAISPVIFFIYLMMNIKKTKFLILKEYMSKTILIIFILAYSCILCLFYGLNLGNLSESLITLTLGISFYYALIIRYVVNKNSINKDLRVLLFSYTLSFFYGVIKFIALKANIGFVLAAFRLIEKRYYDRLAFSFTEPSFISLHVFGILLLIYYLYKDEYIRKRIRLLIFAFCSLTLISGSSGRFLIDVTVVFILCILNSFLSSKVKAKFKVLSLVTVVLFSFVFTTVILTNSRISSVVNNGVNGDPSTAARYFRINASIKGYENEPVKALFGAGIGNAYKFLQYGYVDAFNEYTNSYLGEVLTLQNSTDNHLFSMPITLISEIGIIGFGLLIGSIFVFRKRYNGNLLALLTIMWLYVQFDSLAFYSIWLYIFATKYNVFLKGGLNFYGKATGISSHTNL